MRKYGIILLLLVVAGAATAYYFMGDRQASAAGQGSAQDIARERRQQGGGWWRHGRRRLWWRRRLLPRPSPADDGRTGAGRPQGHDRHDRGGRQSGGCGDRRRGSPSTGTPRRGLCEARRPGPPRPGDRQDRRPRNRRTDQAGGSDPGRIAGDHSSAPGRPEARTEQHGALEEPVRARSAPPADL